MYKIVPSCKKECGFDTRCHANEPWRYREEENNLTKDTTADPERQEAGERGLLSQPRVTESGDWKYPKQMELFPRPRSQESEIQYNVYIDI